MRVGPYELLDILGEGGMDTVYRAHDPRLGRDVALKVLRSEVMADTDRQARFLHEARAVSALKHSNIVTVYDLGAEGDFAYMVMELVEGRSLDHVIPRGGLPLSDTLKIGAQVAEAFSIAHAAHIIHRDLKPANVMLQNDGRVKVLDFGLAKLVERPDDANDEDPDADRRRHHHGQRGRHVAGAGEREGARRALVYEMCTGTPAFQGESQVSVLSEVLRSEPPSLTTLRPDLPQELVRLIARCLRKDPARRVQSMADLKVALDDLREDSESGRLTVAPPSPVVMRGLPRFWWVMAAAAVASIAITISLLWTRTAPASSPADSPGAPIPLTSYGPRSRADVLPRWDAGRVHLEWGW